MKTFMIRLAWKICTVFYKVKPHGEARISYPDWIKTYVNRFPPREVLEKMGATYAQIFTDPMWGEKWTTEEAVQKFEKEIYPPRPSFLSVMDGDEKDPVAGLSWGAVLSVSEIEEEATSALGVKPIGLEEVFRSKGVDKVFYYHEVALLKRFRGGFDPVKFLLRPGLEVALESGVKASMFWSSPESKIVPLTKLLGYETIFRTKNEHGVDIIFLFNPDSRGILKFAQNFSGEDFSKIFRKFSRK